jgi:hypothetical protein
VVIVMALSQTTRNVGIKMGEPHSMGQIGTEAPRWPVLATAALFGVAVVLNDPWEMVQSFLFGKTKT